MELKNIKGRMKKSIGALYSELAKIRTGRAQVDMLDHIRVECYGGLSSIQQIASVNTEDAQTLVLNVWDKSLIKNIEKAIAFSNLGIAPTVKGCLIRLSIPPLSDDRRKGLIKNARKCGENVKVSARNIRRECNQNIRNMEKAKEISEDEAKRQILEVDTITNDTIEKIASIVENKEKALLSF